MNYDEFKSALNDVFNYFQAKAVEKYVLELWFDQVKHIPNGAPLNAIIADMTNLDTLPRNIPKAMRSGWQTWMNANQDRITRQRQDAKTKCGHCGGFGLIHFAGDDQGSKYQYVCRCPHCRNWEDQVSADLPTYSREFLQQHGYQIIEIPKSRLSLKPDLRVLAGEIGKV
jgi:hypothetical protein